MQPRQSQTKGHFEVKNTDPVGQSESDASEDLDICMRVLPLDRRYTFKLRYHNAHSLSRTVVSSVARHAVATDVHIVVELKIRF